MLKSYLARYVPTKVQVVDFLIDTISAAIGFALIAFIVWQALRAFVHWLT